jgi:hypothetical protein
MVKEYKHKSGFVGKMFGDSSFEITNPSGKVVLRTNKRPFNTYNGLIEATDDYVRLYGRKCR